MTILLLVALAAIIWLLLRIARNTADALDRQAAVQTELAALNRRLSALEQRQASENEKEQGSQDA